MMRNSKSGSAASRFLVELLAIIAIAIMAMGSVHFLLPGDDDFISTTDDQAIEDVADADEDEDTTTEDTTDKDDQTEADEDQLVFNYKDIIPEYEGEPYVEVNGNDPAFLASEITDQSFEDYGLQDNRGRCTAATASLSRDTMPKKGEERGDISGVHPSGWKSGMNWERCHLVGWQLGAENDNNRNLITGTHYMNVDGMLPFENEVAEYIHETGNHVMYEVDPAYKGKNMIASGVFMRAYSVEDNGAGVSYNVFCFNVTPDVEIDYKTGVVTGEDTARDNNVRKYVLNTNSYKFHYPSCQSVKLMAEHNKKIVEDSRINIINMGYDPCQNCEP